MFDPTQDQRFRQMLMKENPTAAALIAGRNNRQETVLTEAATRIRRYTGLSATAKHDRPLIVVVTKQDIWESFLPDLDAESPFRQSKQGLSAVDLAVMQKRSAAVRSLLLRVTPEIVAAAESLSDKVVFVGVSALGVAPEKIAPTASEWIEPNRAELPAVRPSTINPRNVALPFLYGLTLSMPGLVPLMRKKPGSDSISSPS